MSYEMYEDFKETMVKTIKTELAAKTANNNQSSDNDLVFFDPTFPSFCLYFGTNVIIFPDEIHPSIKDFTPK